MFASQCVNWLLWPACRCLLPATWFIAMFCFSFEFIMQVFVVFAEILILSLIALMDLCQSYWQIAKLVCLPASLSAWLSVICLWPLLFSICNCQWTNKRLGQQTGLAQALARQFVKFVDDLISPTQHGNKNNIVTQYIFSVSTRCKTHKHTQALQICILILALLILFTITTTFGWDRF